MEKTAVIMLCDWVRVAEDRISSVSFLDSQYAVSQTKGGTEYDMLLKTVRRSQK